MNSEELGFAVHSQLPKHGNGKPWTPVSSNFPIRWLLEMTYNWTGSGAHVFPNYTESNHMGLVILPLSSWKFNFTIYFSFFLFWGIISTLRKTRTKGFIALSCLCMCMYTQSPCKDLIIIKRQRVVACWVLPLNIHISTHSLSNFSWVSVMPDPAPHTGRHAELSKTPSLPSGRWSFHGNLQRWRIERGNWRRGLGFWCGLS